MPDSDLGRAAKLAALGLQRTQLAPYRNSVRLTRNSWRCASGGPALGSWLDVTVIARSPDHADEAVGAALAELERLRRAFDRHDGASALSVLNAEGRLDDAPRELVGLLNQARRFALASGAAFDVTVAPLLALFSGRAGAVPAAEIAERRALVGFGGVEVHRHTVAFRKSGMAVTLDGIAKGAIIDAMARVLERHGLTRWLLNAGGDIRASAPAAEPWTVAVRDPAADAAFDDEPIVLRTGAVATSGAYDVAHGRPHRHIVHGAIGEFPAECASVTVIAPSALAADALATAVFALGPVAGIALIDHLRCGCLVVDPRGRRITSSSWKELTS